MAKGFFAKHWLLHEGDKPIADTLGSTALAHGVAVSQGCYWFFWYALRPIRNMKDLFSRGTK